MAKLSKEEKAAKELEKREKRDQKRAAKRANERTRDGDVDILDLARGELGGQAGSVGQNAMAAGMDWQHLVEENMDEFDRQREEEDAAAEEATGILGCIQYLFRRPLNPPPEWETFRRQEIEAYIAEARATLIGRLGTETFYYRRTRNTNKNYVGDYDNKGRREGRGICLYPDPPRGGGESYFGLWRENLPNGHGVFRWYNGDMYMGEWVMGLQQGYGVYAYGRYGDYPGDLYEGSYYGGLRQGTGVYRYQGSEDRLGGVYLGEWMKGRMVGSGILTYSDGETYIGNWVNDKKDGQGVYTWGSMSGQVAGDKYEGTFRQGGAHGYGRTLFADGGWHKGRYAEGKMNGFGVMQLSDGWEFLGTWKDDELHGEVVTFYAFGFNQHKVVQIYEDGELVRTRDYDTAKDWAMLEALAMEAANAGETTGHDARENIKRVTIFAKRAKESQTLGRDAAEEGRYMLKAANQYKRYLLQWFGLRKYVFPADV